MQTRITPEKLAKIWICGPELIRVGMRKGELPIGTVVKRKTKNTYLIFADKVAAYMGISRDELLERLKEVEEL